MFEKIVLAVDSRDQAKEAAAAAVELATKSPGKVGDRPTRRLHKHAGRFARGATPLPTPQRCPMSAEGRRPGRGCGEVAAGRAGWRMATFAAPACAGGPWVNAAPTHR
jgi:hypothetical protein